MRLRLPSFIIILTLFLVFVAVFLLYSQKIPFLKLPSTLKGDNFEIENQHPDWILGLREGGEEELTAMVKKYLGEDGFLKITLTKKETIETHVSENFPIKIGNFKPHATLGLAWEGKTQHIFLGPEEGGVQDWGQQPLNFYPSFDVFHLLGRKDQDDSQVRLTEEETRNFVLNPLFTLKAKK